MNLQQYDDLKDLISRDNHGCFGCDPENECGLHMSFKTDGTWVYSRVDIPAHVRGWKRLTHGGIITTMLDEVMSWGAIAMLGSMILTKNISVNFLQPIPVETTVIAASRVKEVSSPRESIMEARIEDLEGALLATGEGIFATFSLERAQEMQIMDEVLLQQFREYIESFQEQFVRP